MCHYWEVFFLYEIERATHSVSAIAACWRPQIVSLSDDRFLAMFFADLTVFQKEYILLCSAFMRNTWKISDSKLEKRSVVYGQMDKESRLIRANFADRFLDIVDDSKACYTFYTEEWRILCLFAGNNPGITRRCLQQSANI
ncbi:unnamed protein product [Enterobius vermicularis]|uniref:Cyclic nucleotide-binding domain-containing protein n=1 Tax=Enterobius vermicularis TaxID=51028 RepID=A0A0N4VMH7_ENTVE|nr:unnamed protein product [Enterobius vermicularis]